MSATKVLIQVSIPPRLRNDMLMKEAFEVRNTADGRAFVEWLGESSAEDRDGVMKIAYDRDIDIVDALREKMEAECAQ
jgi:hypothetical protein